MLQQPNEPAAAGWIRVAVNGLLCGSEIRLMQRQAGEADLRRAPRKKVKQIHRRRS